MGVVIYPVRTGTSQGSGALFYDSAALFPVIGAEGVLYVDASTSESYIWTGSAGNPWSALTADNNDAGTFGSLVQKLLTVAKFLGLK